MSHHPRFNLRFNRLNRKLVHAARVLAQRARNTCESSRVE